MDYSALRIIRPKQWYKNFLIFIPIIGSLNITDVNSILISCLGFGILCMSSSGTYILNDLIDFKKDSLHPRKKQRPIPSGKISKNQAIVFLIALLGLSEVFSLFLNYELFLLNSILIASVVIYSIKIKNLFLMDVLAIAGNYVIRAMCGAYLIDVKISPWLIIGIFLLALLLAFGKRRNELLFLDKSKVEFRYVLKHYTKRFLDVAIIGTAVSVMGTYVAYAISGPEQVGDWRLLISIPLAFFILITYLKKLFSGNIQGKELDDLLTTEKKLFVSILGYALLVIVLIYFIPENTFGRII